MCITICFLTQLCCLVVRVNKQNHLVTMGITTSEGYAGGEYTPPPHIAKKILPSIRSAKVTHPFPIEIRISMPLSLVKHHVDLSYKIVNQLTLGVLYTYFSCIFKCKLNSVNKENEEAMSTQS